MKRLAFWLAVVLFSANAEASAKTDEPLTVINLVRPAKGGVLESFTSQYGEDYIASALTNGLTDEAGWSSTMNPEEQSFVFSFAGGESAVLNEAVIYGGTAEGMHFCKDVEVWTSADGTSYTGRGRGILANSAGSTATIELAGIIAKKVKLVITSGYRTDYWELAEFKVYGAFEAAGGERGHAFELFAFDNYMTAGDYTQPELRARTLKELGYEGMGTRGTNLVEQTELFEKAGLKLFSTYIGLNLDAEQKYDENLKTAIKQLKGKDTILWFFVKSEKYKPASDDGDAVAAKAIREIADAADDSGLKIAFYPHANLYVETCADSLRLARKVNRPNVGVSFNLCHWLKVDGDIDYRPILKEALPYLFLVSINGAETGDTKKMGWDKLIQTLDKGSFDNYKLLKYLKDIGYTGPVGLQGYSIKGDPKQNLTGSMRAWREINEKLSEE